MGHWQVDVVVSWRRYGTLGTPGGAAWAGESLGSDPGRGVWELSRKVCSGDKWQSKRLIPEADQEGRVYLSIAQKCLREEKTHKLRPGPRWLCELRAADRHWGVSSPLPRLGEMCSIWLFYTMSCLREQEWTLCSDTVTPVNPAM